MPLLWWLRTHHPHHPWCQHLTVNLKTYGYNSNFSVLRLNRSEQEWKSKLLTEPYCRSLKSHGKGVNSTVGKLALRRFQRCIVRMQRTYLLNFMTHNQSYRSTVAARKGGKKPKIWTVANRISVILYLWRICSERLFICVSSTELWHFHVLAVQDHWGALVGLQVATKYISWSS